MPALLVSRPQARPVALFALALLGLGCDHAPVFPCGRLRGNWWGDKWDRPASLQVLAKTERRGTVFWESSHISVIATLTLEVPSGNGLFGLLPGPAILVGGLAARPMQHKAAIWPAVQENLRRKCGERRKSQYLFQV